RYYEAETDDGRPRVVTDDGRVVQTVRTMNLGELHRRLRDTMLVRTRKDELPGLPARRFQRVPAPPEAPKERGWFDRQAHRVRWLAKQLREALASKDLDEVRSLEGSMKALRSAITRQATRAKRRAILDYLLALPRDRKVVVIASHRDLLLDQLA